MIITRKRLLMDIFSFTDYQNHLHFVSLRALNSIPDTRPQGHENNILSSHY